MDRDNWIETICKGFVHHSKKNKAYYRLILEVLWPRGHHIPGPIIKKRNLDQLIEKHRGGRYLDLARRIREMQGEEGIFGLVRIGSGSGTSYQLQNLELGPKRTPRTGLPPDDWERVLKKYGYRCANCGRSQDEMRLDEDHKVPRVRGGGDELVNWQPLCKECNNFKSTMCRNCTIDCNKCPWAFPEKYGQIQVSQENIELVRKVAKNQNRNPSVLLNEIISSGFDSLIKRKARK